ncbi:MAG TPA: PKD domain-containing protein, partial [Candidatus Kapabacteria bacterium]|nr:PKD domain-containing protein [Candidatus Kapabacteria bacterium]
MILPDSAIAWGDSATMSVVSSTPLSSSSIYAWSFGDSSTLLSRNDTIIHYYLNPGDFTVKVDLTDTSNHQSLGTQSGTVHVVATHFNLALLQTMKYVDFTFQCQTDTSSTACWGEGLCGSAPGLIPLTWNGANFSMGSSYNTSHQDTLTPGYGEWDAERGEDSLGGLLDINSSQLIRFSQGVSFTKQEQDFENGFVAGGCWSTSNTTCSAENVPFIRESDTDVVFEAKEDLAKNAYYENSISDKVRFCSDGQGDQSFRATANFADSTVHRYIIIRF